MTLERSATHIYCQTCANAWPLTGREAEATGYYFRSTTTFNIGDYASPKQIADLVPEEQMTFCPQCDVEQLAEHYRKPAPGIQESPFFRGDSRVPPDEHDEPDPGDGDADVVHRV